MNRLKRALIWAVRFGLKVKAQNRWKRSSFNSQKREEWNSGYIVETLEFLVQGAVALLILWAVPVGWVLQPAFWTVVSLTTLRAIAWPIWIPWVQSRWWARVPTAALLLWVMWLLVLNPFVTGVKERISSFAEENLGVPKRNPEGTLGIQRTESLRHSVREMDVHGCRSHNHAHDDSLSGIIALAELEDAISYRNGILSAVPEGRGLEDFLVSEMKSGKLNPGTGRAARVLSFVDMGITAPLAPYPSCS